MEFNTYGSDRGGLALWFNPKVPLFSSHPKQLLGDNHLLCFLVWAGVFGGALMTTPEGVAPLTLRVGGNPTIKDVRGGALWGDPYP